MVWATSYHHYDALGSTRELSDSTETVTDTFVYDAWGNEVARTGTTETPFRWNGHSEYFWDEDAETFQVRTRPYRPTNARWLTVDPIWPNDGINTYVCVKNLPLMRIDPSGRLTVSPRSDNLGAVLKCGATAKITWDFLLDKPAPCNGYFVQKIDVHCIVSPCQTCPNHTPRKPSYSFWEAFWVGEGETSTPYAPTDQSVHNLLNGDCGVKVTRGTIKFFCEYPPIAPNGAGTGDLNMLWESMQKHGRGDDDGGGCSTVTNGRSDISNAILR